MQVSLKGFECLKFLSIIMIYFVSVLVKVIYVLRHSSNCMRQVEVMYQTDTYSILNVGYLNVSIQYLQ